MPGGESAAAAASASVNSDRPTTSKHKEPAERSLQNRYDNALLVIGLLKQLVEQQSKADEWEPLNPNVFLAKNGYCGECYNECEWCECCPNCMAAECQCDLTERDQTLFCEDCGRMESECECPAKAAVEAAAASALAMSKAKPTTNASTDN